MTMSQSCTVPLCILIWLKYYHSLQTFSWVSFQVISSRRTLFMWDKWQVVWPERNGILNTRNIRKCSHPQNSLTSTIIPVMAWESCSHGHFLIYTILKTKNVLIFAWISITCKVLTFPCPCILKKGETAFKEVSNLNCLGLCLIIWV